MGFRVQKATELAKNCPDTQVIMIADRESDLYDLYEEARKTEGTKADWLIRVNGDTKARINGAGFEPLIAAGASKIGLGSHASMRAYV